MEMVFLDSLKQNVLVFSQPNRSAQIIQPHARRAANQAERLIPAGNTKRIVPIQTHPIWLLNFWNRSIIHTPMGSVIAK